MMTTEDLLALGATGVERWLVSGPLRERAWWRPKDRRHAQRIARLGSLIEVWVESQAAPRGQA